MNMHVRVWFTNGLPHCLRCMFLLFSAYIAYRITYTNVNCRCWCCCGKQCDCECAIKFAYVCMSLCRCFCARWFLPEKSRQKKISICSRCSINRNTIKEATHTHHRLKNNESMNESGCAMHDAHKLQYIFDDLANTSHHVGTIVMNVRINIIADIYKRQTSPERNETKKYVYDLAVHIEAIKHVLRSQM